MASRPPRTPSKEGLTEYALLVGFLALAAAGAVALFGDEIRGALGLPPARAAAEVRAGEGVPRTD
jgi:hypothetical protein